MPKTAHVLLIEDDTSLATNLCDVLTEDDFKVTVCNRGDEGLRRASEEECDVVLTDLRLPGLGGLELVRQLHDTQPHLPVVLMTAHAPSKPPNSALTIICKSPSRCGNSSACCNAPWMPAD